MKKKIVIVDPKVHNAGHRYKRFSVWCWKVWSSQYYKRL